MHVVKLLHWHLEYLALTAAYLQIGGVRAPSPVGELGNVEMTQATELSETKWECIGRDMLLTGHPLTLPALCLPNQQLLLCCFVCRAAIYSQLC